jgi:hypothetical protein
MFGTYLYVRSGYKRFSPKRNFCYPLTLGDINGSIMFCMYLLFVSCHSFMYRCGIKGGGMGLGWDGRKWCCMNGISNWNCMWCVVL